MPPGGVGNDEATLILNCCCILRIIRAGLEVFHGLTDGIGVLEFISFSEKGNNVKLSKIKILMFRVWHVGYVVGIYCS